MNTLAALHDRFTTWLDGVDYAKEGTYFLKMMGVYHIYLSLTEHVAPPKALTYMVVGMLAIPFGVTVSLAIGAAIGDYIMSKAGVGVEE